VAKPLPVPAREKEQEEAVKREVELNGMHGQREVIEREDEVGAGLLRERITAVGEAHRPGQVGACAEIVAVEEAAPATDRDGQANRGSEKVSVGLPRQAVAAAIQQQPRGAAQVSAPRDAGAAEIEDSQRLGQGLRQVLEKVEQAGTDERAGHDPQADAQRVVGDDTRSRTGAVPHDDKCGQHRQSVHHRRGGNQPLEQPGAEGSVQTLGQARSHAVALALMWRRHR